MFLHPASFCFHTGDYRGPWLAYHDLVNTSKPFLRDVTSVPLLALLMLGGELRVSHEGNRYRTSSSKEELSVIEVGNSGWVKCKGNARDATLVKYLRKGIDQLLVDKFENPYMAVAERYVLVTDCIHFHRVPANWWIWCLNLLPKMAYPRSISFVYSSHALLRARDKSPVVRTLAGRVCYRCQAQEYMLYH